MKIIRCKNNKKVISIIGYTLMIANSIVLYLTFLAAHFNGGSITITVNTYGESAIEFIYIPIVLVIGIIGFVLLLKE